MSLPWRDLRKGDWKWEKEEKGHRNVEKSLNVKSQHQPNSRLSVNFEVIHQLWSYPPACMCCDRYSQQTERLETIERPHWYAPQAVVAQDSLHTEQTCWHGDKCRKDIFKKQRGISEHSPVYNYIPLSKEVEQTQTHNSNTSIRSETHTCHIQAQLLIRLLCAFWSFI